MPTHAERLVWGMGDGTDLQVHEASLGRIGEVMARRRRRHVVSARREWEGTPQRQGWLATWTLPRVAPWTLR